MLPPLLSPVSILIKKRYLSLNAMICTSIWQFPQGGIDEGESSEEALFRELKEEIGTKKVEIIAEYPEWIAYDFPAARGCKNGTVCRTKTALLSRSTQRKMQ